MSLVSQANQHSPDEREQKCWDLYVDSITKGIPNAKRSALTVGYSEEHADNITLQGWFKGRLEKLKRRELFSKSEKKLEEALDFSPTKDDGSVDVGLLRVQTDVAKHITQTLGKDEGYSTKTETDLTSGGEKLNLVVEFTKPNEDSTT